MPKARIGVSREGGVGEDAPVVRVVAFDGEGTATVRATQSEEPAKERVPQS
jgi:hypothetical protein